MLAFRGIVISFIDFGLGKLYSERSASACVSVCFAVSYVGDGVVIFAVYGRLPILQGVKKMLCKPA